MAIKVGVYGATGYMGGEAVRILLEHPEVELAWATSRSGEEMAEYHRNLYGSELKLTKPDQVTDCDVVLCALPSGVTMQMAPALLDSGHKVIDLGADFRLEDKATWERVYGKEHTAWDLAETAPYGIPELYREKIGEANVVANPGCYSSAAILGMAPLLQAGMIDPGKIIVDGLSGTAGAGAELDRTMHHPEIGNNLVPYNVVDHRHTYEIEQELGKLAGESVSVHFSAVYVPIVRGILDICHGFVDAGVTREQVLDLYRDFYGNEQFIKVFDMPKDANASWQYKPYPWVNAVSGTNYCHIGLDVDEKRGRVVVFSALDSIGKGGAHAGVQNMNLMFGLPEKMGLERWGLHPM